MVPTRASWWYFRECPVSSPDEFPKQRSREEGFSGLVFDPTEWQRIGNQIDAAMIFARADFVNVLGAYGWAL